ncbi:MAG: carboxypeptidase-like regulatory domain-containing protein, partial [Edaphobacter sp.]
MHQILEAGMNKKWFGGRLTLLFAMVCAFALVAPVLAQSDSSSISGTVTDSSGAVLPNAKITVHNNATGADRSLTSSQGGDFTLTNLPSGDYNIRAEADGFQTTTLTSVHLDPSIGRRIDIALKVGAASTEVNVEAGINTVQTESSSVGQLVTQEQVKNIQLNGRNPLYLSQLEPGVVRSNSMAAF